MKKVCFCGISGNGMSPLAQILSLEGYEVYGSDRSFDADRDEKNRKALEAMGITIIPQDGSGISADMEAVYISAALDDTNPDIKAATGYNIPILKRSDLLAGLFHSYPFGIAVGGTSGKSTTTAMIGYIFDMLGKKPCLVNGAMLKNYENLKGLPNFIYNKDKICVIEADESDGSICKYHPNISLINNISHDHTSLENLLKYFTAFAQNTKDTVVMNLDCELCKQIKTTSKIVTFSLTDNQADFFASDIKCLENGISYTFRGKNFKLNLFGRFNVANAIAAFAVVGQIGIDPFEAAKILEGFVGVKRRLEIVGTTKDNITIIDDFAHNPDKIGSSIKALKDYPRRLIVMYQSHSPFSAKNTGDEVAEAVVNSMQQNDIFLMPEVYMLNKQTDIGISAQNIVNKAKELGLKNGLFFETKDEIYNYILKTAQPNDLVVIMGARDNSLPDFSRKLLKDLS